jgi:hypothetical protein
MGRRDPRILGGVMMNISRMAEGLDREDFQLPFQQAGFQPGSLLY